MLLAGDLACKVCQLAQRCEFAVVDISENNPNVFFELGLLYGLGRNVLLIRRTGTRIPADLGDGSR
jgi:predicted nucleotide-binding protein